MRQTDLHCELTGLNVLRGLSGKPEPGCLNTAADSELLSATLKSLTISSMTGISEGPRNAAEAVRRCAGVEHMKACVRQDLHESTRARADEERAKLLKKAEMCLTYSLVSVLPFFFAESHNFFELKEKSWRCKTTYPHTEGKEGLTLV